MGYSKLKVKFEKLDSYLGIYSSTVEKPQYVELTNHAIANFGYTDERTRGGFVEKIERITIENDSSKLVNVIVKLEDGRTFNSCFLRPA